MFISNIVIRNFKSFKEETINLDKLNILVGSNAAGKSNTIAILRFLNYVISNGLENALSLSGGIEYVLNTTIGRKSPMFIGFSLNCEEEEWVYLANKKKNDRLLFAGIDYEFEITPHKRGDGYRITHDYLTIKYYQVTEEKKDLVLFNRNKIISVEYKRNAKGITTNFINKSDISGENDIQEEIVPTFLNRYMNRNRKELILNYMRFFMPPMFYSTELVRIYDFDPTLMKKSAMLSSISALNEDGSNLANVLHELLKGNNDRRKLENLLNDCLPFVESICTEKNFDKSISYKVKERYSTKSLYANFLSDGTVNILALIVALYFEKNCGIIVLEEPERNLHPYLMNKLMEMAKEKSNEKQIIITTHTPELLKHAESNVILFASRSIDGFTNVTHPTDSTMVQEFLKQEIGLDSLFIQNLLGE